MRVGRRSSELWRSLLGAVLIAAAFSALRFAGCTVLDAADDRALDLRFLRRGSEAAASEVVIVAVDDRSIERVGRWPWARDVQAKLIDGIAAGRPAVIGLDIVHSEASWRSDPLPDDDDDADFAAALRRAGNVVLGYFVDFSQSVGQPAAGDVATYDIVRSAAGVPPSAVPHAARAVVNLAEIRAAGREQAYFNVLPDAGDGSVRRLPMVMRLGERHVLPLPLAMVRAGTGATAAVSYEAWGVDEVRFGDVSVPVSEDGQMLLNYRGPGRTFEHVSAADLLSAEVDAVIFRNRFVIVGVSAIGVGDLRVTPFDGVFPGVEVQATALDNLLRADFVQRPKWLVLVEIATMIAGALLLAAALQMTGGWWGAIVATALIGAYLVVSQWSFERLGIALGVVHPLLAFATVYAASNIGSYLREERERRKVRHALELYLSPSMAELLSRHPERLELGGEKRWMTVLFSDIRGFTSLSEGADAQELVELLNAYLGEMTDAVFASEGMLDKYVGDAVMAVWGAPLEQADHAERSVSCAVDMLRRLVAVNQQWTARGWPPLRIGIGINSGEMVFGNMGSARHLSLTVIGDDVNTAARFEGLTKEYGVEIIVGRETWQKLGDEMATRELDFVRVKGKDRPLPIYEVSTAAPGEVGEAFAEFASGLAAYRARRWRAAAASFARVLELRPGDGAARLFVERCKEMGENDPGPEWDGVATMTSK